MSGIRWTSSQGFAWDVMHSTGPMIPSSDGFWYREEIQTGSDKGKTRLAWFFSNPITVSVWNKYPSVVLAGANAIREINPSSIKENKEYAGWIVQNTDGSYTMTKPRLGGVDWSNPGPKPNNAVSSYHTHGDFDPKYDSENFSPKDKQYIPTTQVNGYLGTPENYIKVYEWQTGGQRVIWYPLRGYLYWGWWK